MNSNCKNKIIRESFGLSISVLFSAVCGNNVAATFDEKKAMYLALLVKLLRNRVVRFIAPVADCYVSPTNPTPKLTVDDLEAQWNSPVDDIMAYVRTRWPVSVANENDVALVYYFYDLPGLIWLGDSVRTTV